jgi:hypothetical protein
MKSPERAGECRGDNHVSNLPRGVDTRPFSLHYQSDYAEREWLTVGSKRRLDELGAKAAATLRCVRRGVPAPNAAAATEGPEGPRRQAERSRWRLRCYIPHLRESNPPSLTNHVQRRLAGGFDE